MLFAELFECVGISRKVELDVFMASKGSRDELETNFDARGAQRLRTRKGGRFGVSLLVVTKLRCDEFKSRKEICEGWQL